MRITLKDIARHCGVSVATVSLVLSEKPGARIAEATRRQVLETARELGYPGSGRGMPRDRGTAVLLYVFPKGGREHLGTSFFAGVLRELQAGCDGAVVEAEFDPADPLRSYRRMLAYGPTGYVTHCGSLLETLASHGDARPVFMLQGEGRPESIQQNTGLRAYHYIVDDLAVGRAAACCLADRGCRNAAVVFPQSRSRCSRERFGGFEESFVHAGGTLTEFRLPEISCPKVEEFIDGIELKFDAFYFFSDAMAISGMRALLARGVRIPGEVLVIGTDNLYWGRFCYPSLTTMNLHEEVFAGRILSDFAMLRQGGHLETVTVRVPVELVERESTASLFT